MLIRYLFLGMLCSCCWLTSADAQVLTGDPQVRWVELDEVEGKWLEVEIQVERRAGTPATGLNLEVTVLLSASGEAAAGGMLLAQGEVRLLGLFEGKRKVFFYVPPEAVEHYRLERRLAAWRVNGPGAARTGGLEAARAAKLLEDGESKANKIGLLRIYETPFYTENFAEKLAESPAYVR